MVSPNVMEDLPARIILMSAIKTILASSGTVSDFAKLQKDRIAYKESRWMDLGEKET